MSYWRSTQKRRGKKKKESPTDLAGLVDVSGHDSDLALSRADDSGAVGSNQAGLVLGEEGLLDLDHVLLGNTLGDAHGEGDLGLDGLQDGLGGMGRGHVDHRGVGSGLLHGIPDGVEHGEPEVLGSGLSGGDSSDHVGAVLDGLLGVEGSLEAFFFFFFCGLD